MNIFLLFAPFEIYTMLLTILSHFFLCMCVCMCVSEHADAHTHTVSLKWYYRIQVFTKDTFFKKNLQLFFLIFVFVPYTKVTNVNKLLWIFVCLPPCLHNYIEHLYYIQIQNVLNILFYNSGIPEYIYATTSCFSHSTIHHGNHLSL